MAAFATSLSEPMTRWGDIPEELKDMMLCHACNLQSYDKDGSVVLPCAHVMCLECMKERVYLTATKDKIECPKCAAVWELPFGNILGFPKDVFSLVLNNSLLGKSIGTPRPNPKCALHPREDVSRYCKECSLSACAMCCERRHDEHVVEPITSQGERLDQELAGFRYNLERKISQIGNMVENTKEDQTRMAADFQWTCDKVHQEVQATIAQLKLQADKIQEEAQKRIDRLKLQQDKVQQEAKERVDELKLSQHNVERQFVETLKQLEEQKESLENDQLFIDTLYNMGNQSDKTSRVPGLKSMIAKGKQFSGRKLEFKGLSWEFDVNEMEAQVGSHKLQITETVLESGKAEESFFPGLQLVSSVQILCKPARYTRFFPLFNQSHIAHVSDQDEHRDKICLHDTTGAVIQSITVPGMKQCADLVVVDAAAGQIVVADKVRTLTIEMFQGRSAVHLNGPLHWLLVKNTGKEYQVTRQELSPLQCVQREVMNLNNTGELLVLTLCTTGEHPKQLLVYNTHNRRVLRTITLSGHVFRDPISAVNISSNTFVVVDFNKNQVVWINQHGQVLQQYGRQLQGTLNRPRNILQYSNGPLLITDSENHRILLVNNRGDILCSSLLQNTIIKVPGYLHLDELAGLLYVCCQTPNDREVNIFQFLPCAERIKQISLSVKYE